MGHPPGDRFLGSYRDKPLSVLSVQLLQGLVCEMYREQDLIFRSDSLLHF